MYIVHPDETYGRPSAATIGFFDGVHRGHHHLFGQLRKAAAARGLDTLAVTFGEHPRQTLAADYRPHLLTTKDEKLALLDKEELDACAVLRFDKELAALTAREFMERYLRDRLGVRCLVIGYDHHFGSSRGEGFVQYAAYGRELGIDVVRATALEWGGVTVSSSAVRRFLSAGNVEMARVCLGRAYELRGTVIHGREVGRSLGYPTANLRPDSADKMLPAAGVYAARIEPAEDGSGLPAEGVRAMVNVGCRPTIDDGEELTIEAHLFDFAGDLYGRRLRLLFERRLREERRFPSLDALRRQLDTDAARTLELTAP